MTSSVKCHALLMICLIVVLLSGSLSWSQDLPNEIESRAEETLQSAQETAGAVVAAVDSNEEAQQVSTGILTPIYQLAEAFSFSAFHWIAFAVMVAGVVSFALQLTLGKLVVLSKLGFSLAEILSDSLGLIVSLIGLVLTTQAATENSGFANSATAVISASVVGAVFGFVFYIWGQRQELQAVAGRRQSATKPVGSPTKVAKT